MNFAMVVCTQNDEIGDFIVLVVAIDMVDFEYFEIRRSTNMTCRFLEHGSSILRFHRALPPFFFLWWRDNIPFQFPQTVMYSSSSDAGNDYSCFLGLMGSLASGLADSISQAGAARSRAWREQLGSSCLYPFSPKMHGQ